MRGQSQRSKASEMTAMFPPGMLEATRLTREGRLLEATALIQRMLGGAGAAPDSDPAQRVIRVEHVFLPQLFFGLISLILLFNIYLIGQKFTLNSTRRALISELILNERLESLSLVDPLTQLMNRRALNELIPREVARSNRMGSPLTFLIINLHDFQKVRAAHGDAEANALLSDFTTLVKGVFRGADLLFRQGTDEFLVVMPDTTEEQADAPVQRLLRAVEHWNINSRKNYELCISWALAAYATGTDFEHVLRTIDRRVFQKQHNLAATY
jgi:diguanylate cyclase (GGDEF)-like protein